MDITKLFGKLVEHENKLKRLADIEVKSKKKEKGKEEKQNISLKYSTSKVKTLNEESDNSDD